MAGFWKEKVVLRFQLEIICRLFWSLIGYVCFLIAFSISFMTREVVDKVCL